MGVRMMWSEIDLIITILAFLGTLPTMAYFLWKELTKD